MRLHWSIRCGLLASSLCAPGCRREPPPERLVVAVPSSTTSMMPWAVSEEFALSIQTNVFETLVEPDAAMVLRPVLAESWHNTDELTWIVKLRQGVRFHDGSLLQAADVVSSVLQARDAPESKRRAALDSLASVEALDANTVRIRTRAPFAPLATRLAEVAVWRPSRRPDMPLGTGRYTVRSWIPGGDVVLAGFDGHRNGPPPIRTVEYRVIPDKQREIEALKAGEVHLLIDVSAEAFAELSGAPGVRTFAQKGLRVVFLAMDCAREQSPYVSLRPNPLRDVRVRRAVALAIDRAALVSGPLGGFAEVIDPLVGPGVFGFHERLPPHPYDPHQGRRLLAEAGAGSFAVDLDFMPQKYRAMETVVAALKRDLGQVGIELRPRPRDTASFFRKVETRDTSMYLLGWVNSAGDAAATYDYLVRSPASGYGAYNGGGYSSAEVEGLLSAASRTLDSGSRRGLLLTVAELLQRDVALVPLYRQTDLYASSERLDFEPRVARRVRAHLLRWEP